ncbi:TetR/AcrR family transcriptional regulator [Nonomuraea sp. K274]|uniref:TetR/AcrR family transcriptional regulator n=1 Tax=Nonomuraea cypriaca TaxID=1187855 RepID=A0A931AHZ5_9ACTN|nr:TetR/AcrR family transcriptional regulator [Nonomuraea cypriaca]MBF8191379.1 TetR/AcrR family transcriptional regulator [Nonomuraea cypriaca]
MNVEAHARRRDEFLDAAQRLIESNGYDQMSIQDVLEDVGTSRGAFYHYFGSKHELLLAVVERFGQALAAFLTPIAVDPELSATERLRKVFAALTVRKGQEHEALVSTLRVWYSDGNVRVRQKARVGIIDHLTRLLQVIVAQGVREGVFVISDLEMTSRVVATLLQDLNDELADQVYVNEVPAVERIFAAFTWAIERILGVPEGSVALVDTTILCAWFDPDQEQTADSTQPSETNRER